MRARTVVLIVLSSAATGCALGHFFSRPNHLDATKLVRFTRYYEREMGLPAHRILLVSGDDAPLDYGWCAESFAVNKNGRPKVDGFPLSEIAYDLRCRGVTEKQLALHECCHQRMRHHEIACDRDAEDKPIRRDGCLDRDEMEAEARTCEYWYRNR